ncbi:hypothetical protein WME88_32010 [Sorangium sp. So ce216]
MRPSSRRRRALASSFLVTVAGGVAACGSTRPPSDPPEETSNPPRPELPPPTGTTGVEDAAAPDALQGAGATAATGAATSEAPQDAGAAPQDAGAAARDAGATAALDAEEGPLPPPAPGGSVVRSPDGTCRQVFPNPCPQPRRAGDGALIMCNPPPPRPVACPPEGGRR